MKTAPSVDAVVGQSHAVATKVELRQPDGTVIAPLPITGGTVSGDVMRGMGVWSASLQIADMSWAPATATDPLSPLTGNHLSIQRGVTPYGQPQAWVEVARVWLDQTSVQIARGDQQLRVDAVSPARYAEQAADMDYAVQAGETCQNLAKRVVTPHLPYTPQVLDTTTPVPAPIGATWENQSAEQVVMDVMSAANARLVFDALGRIVIRPTLAGLDTSTFGPVRTLSTDLDIVRYNLTMSRRTFANEVQVRFGDTENNPSAVSDGGASITGGPLRVGGPAGRLLYATQRDIEVDQVAANAYAYNVLQGMKQGWVTVEVEAVQDPRLEPWDTFDATYLGTTLRHRVMSVSLDLGTAAMTITARTAVPDSGGPP